MLKAEAEIYNVNDDEDFYRLLKDLHVFLLCEVDDSGSYDKRLGMARGIEDVMFMMEEAMNPDE